MKNFFEIDGNVSLREARMTHITLRPGAESAPAPEQPQGERRFDMRADQVPEELLRSIADRVTGAQGQANETAEDQMKRTEEQAQRYIDACLAEGPLGRQKAIEYIRELNAALHQMKPQAYHGGAINMQISIKPYNPTQFPPEVIARKNKINELQGKINQVDRNIRELMRGFSQNAVQYRNQKGAAMNRGNIAPEVNQMLMQFPQASMQASAGPLNQLYALKFQLQQELAGVKSGMIKVAVLGPGGEQDPSLINDPRYAASGMGDTRFNLGGAPGGIGPDGLPLPNAMPSAAEQAAILRLAARWRSVDTEEERDTVEGFLMMDGVDVDSSNLDKDEIVMASPEEKGLMFLMGLITVLKSFLDRLNRKKTEIGESTVTDKDPATMKTEEITAEKEGNDKKIDELKVKKSKNETDIKDAEKKLKNVEKPLEGDAKTKVETELKQMKEELKKINEEIEKLEKRNKVLADPTKKSKESGKITKQDQMNDDPFVREFMASKQEAKLMMRAAVMSAIKNGYTEKIQQMAELIDIEADDPNIGSKVQSRIGELESLFDSIIDGAQLEKNEANEYRLTFDFIDISKQIERSGTSKKEGRSDPTDEEMAIMGNMFGERSGYRFEGGKMIGKFMSEAEIRKFLP